MTKRKPIIDKRDSKRRRDKSFRSDEGTKKILADQNAHAQRYNLDWFSPTDRQKEIIYSMCTNDLTAVQGSSGTGKSTTAIWQALREIQQGRYKKLLFIKTPAEQGSDSIGFLSGDADEKLTKHFYAMRSIFHSFMSKEKLAMEEKRGTIEFSIPNFVQGMTFDNCLIIIDEMQSIDINTTKLLLERTGEDSKVVCLGDRHQRYSTKKRSDGFSHFVSMITSEDEFGDLVSTEKLMGYVEMTSEDNMRSGLSKRVVELYEEGE